MSLSASMYVTRLRTTRDTRLLWCLTHAVCVFVYVCVQERVVAAAADAWENTRRRVPVTPAVLSRFIDRLLTAVEERNASINLTMTRRSVAIERVTNTEIAIAELRAAAATSAPVMAEAVGAATRAHVAAEAAAAALAAAQEAVEEADGRAAAAVAAAAEAKTECDDAMSEVEPPLEAATTALSGLSVAELADLKAQRKPHPLMRLAIDAQCVFWEVRCLLARVVTLLLLLWHG